MSRGSWLSITLLILSIYSTVLSALWVIVAFRQPRWGKQISSSGGIAPSTASLLTALFAKTIEMTFVTVFVAFIGQVLSRRAFIRNSTGMTIAEMTMWNWVVVRGAPNQHPLLLLLSSSPVLTRNSLHQQPGSLITHWETLPYAAVTVLGVICLVATVAATFYTTASDAMVSPKLKYGVWEQKVLSGYVMASYANPYFVKANCPTPLTGTDYINSGESCLDVQYSGNCKLPNLSQPALPSYLES